MSLNVGFKGFVYDVNDNLIDAKFQIHYVTQNVWNDVRDTTGGYYSANAGDTDALSQTGIMKSGDIILISFWVGDGLGGPTVDNRDNIFDLFGVTAITHDGVSADYSINIQLKSKTAPVINWSIPSTGTINRTITAINSSYDTSVSYYSGTAIHQRQTYYGRTVFPRVGLLATTYDWDFGETTDHTRIYTDIGDYTPDITVVNDWGLVSTDTKNIRIKYNTPILDIIFTPDGIGTPVRVTDIANIGSSIFDEDSRISSIEHRWDIIDRDTGSVITNTLVETNTDLTFGYNQTIDVLQRHLARLVVSWNDGFEPQTLYRTEELQITNWLPITNFDIAFLNDTTVRFIPNCTDLDGVVEQYTWELYSKVPFTDNDYSLAVTSVNSAPDQYDVVFDSPGHYKMRLISTDDVGGTSELLTEFDIAPSGNCVGGDMLADDVFFIISSKQY